MTPCEALIREKIQTEGPLSVEAFMELALHHPEHGYYRKAPALGKDGDFITAPEVSQMFGEIIGAWCVDLWQKLGSPPAFNLVELGPGRGTLLGDALRVAQNTPPFLEAMTLSLVERNVTLRHAQENTLAPYTPHWCEDFSEISLKDRPTLVITNEFFDAFPIRQFSQTDGDGFEKHVVLEKNELLFRDLKTDVSPTTMEHSPQAEAYFKEVCQCIQKTGGALLVIDYGYQDGQGHTLQALKNHAHISPLTNVGEVDLTAHVNFGAFMKIADSLSISYAGPTTQGRFLSNLGILERSQQLQSQNPLKIPQIMSELMRLTHPQQMGSLFQVLCFYSSQTLNPEGF